MPAARSLLLQPRVRQEPEQRPAGVEDSTPRERQWPRARTLTCNSCSEQEGFKQRIGRRGPMNFWNQDDRQTGKAGWILLWLLGVPIPILLIIFLMRGCT